MFSEQTFLLRKDLHPIRIHMGREPMWVVKDPLNGRFFYFDEHEYAILQALDGQTPARKICADICRQFAPYLLTLDRLLVFLSELANADLLLGINTDHSAGDGPSLPTRKSAGWGNLLAIRIPGVNPTRFLNAFYPCMRWIFRPTTVCIGFVLICVAFLLAMTQFEEYLSTLPAIDRWTTPSVMLTTLMLIAAAKIVHELAHALTARHFGVRCESIGVMLLFLVPCLYCDVTDAWKLHSRRERILISAAGMIAELVIAAIAFLLWMVANPGPFRSTLAVLMAVCSVNTVLFNGNPLMRYDGYYIFCDVVGIPNLATSSSNLLRSAVRRWIWGSDDVLDSIPTPRAGFLATYGIVSLLYRTILIGVLAYTFYQLWKGWGLSSIGLLIASVLLAPLLISSVFSIATPPAGYLFLTRSSIRRPAMAGGLALFVLLCLALVPLPRRIDAPFRMESRESREIHVTVPGHLEFAQPAGTHVRAGEVLAKLQNHELDREIQAVTISLKTLVSRRRGLEARRGLLGDADELPALNEQIHALENNRKLLEQKRDELVIRAPVDGTLAAPPNRQTEQSDRHLPVFWSGTPLDPDVLECYLERGTLLGIVVPPTTPVATLYVTQRRVQRVVPGAAVRIWLPGKRTSSLHATVTEVSPSPIEEVPREILAKQLLPAKSASPTSARSLEPVYQVTAKLSSPTIDIPLRTSGRASIRGRRTSLLTAMREWILEAFDW